VRLPDDAADRAAHYLATGLWCSASVGWSLPVAARRWPDRVAVVISAPEGSVEYRYAELLDRVEAVAAQLAAHGVRAGDRVVGQLPNGIELLVLIMAAWHLGAVAVPVVPMYREREMRYILSVTRPAVVAAAATRGDREPAAELDELLDELGQRPALRYLLGGARRDWAALPEPAGSSPSGAGLSAPHRPAGPDECCLLLFTSGTTSDPKGVRHSSRSLLAEARSYRDQALLGADTPVLIPAPVAHIGAVVACTLLPCTTGARTVVLTGWNPDLAVRACAENGVALAIGAPIFLSELLDRYEAPDAPTHRLSMFHTGAAPTGGAVLARAHRLGITAWRAWGMTEAPTMSAGRPDDPLERRMNTDGRIDTGCQVQAVDEHRMPLPAGTPGELRLRGPKSMLGYLDPAQQAAAVDGNGWFYTGDIGVVDAAGWVTIQGRLKDVINRGGEKFSATEIEAAIGSHPAIDAVAVVGLPDPRLGERVGAFVTVRAGASWPGEPALLAHLESQRLAKPKLPVVWQVRAELPRTPTGKIVKRTLLAEWTAAADPT
jgi:acyl-CoA synthetase (AMP-forming)/AMP-acid ligase II